MTSNWIFFMRFYTSFCVYFFSDAIQTLQTEVTRLKERLESCLRNKKPLSSVRAALAQENYAHLNASTPRVRLVS